MVAGGDFRRMAEISWWGTCIFYWSWLSLSFVILMNIVISILTESHIAATRVIEYIDEFKLDKGNSEDEISEDDHDDEDGTASDDDADGRPWDERAAALESLLRTMLQELPPGPTATPRSTPRAVYRHDASGSDGTVGGLATPSRLSSTAAVVSDPSHSSEATVNPEAEPELGPDPEPALVLDLLQRLGLEEKVIAQVRAKLVPQPDQDATAHEARQTPISSAAAREARAN
jgi:hypothetical protein